MNRKLRIKCILHGMSVQNNFLQPIVSHSISASTALTQKRDECSITYLNRGQQYAIHLQDTQGYEGTITSTIAITFHDPGHRNAAANYWKFWIGQQRDPQHARAIDLGKQTLSAFSLCKNPLTCLYHMIQSTNHRVSSMSDTPASIVSRSTGKAAAVPRCRHASIVCPQTSRVSRASRASHSASISKAPSHALLKKPSIRPSRAVAAGLSAPYDWMLLLLLRTSGLIASLAFAKSSCFGIRQASFRQSHQRTAIFIRSHFHTGRRKEKQGRCQAYCKTI